MKLRIEIELNNAAFEPVTDEVTRILKEYAATVEGGSPLTLNRSLQDVNGNRVGTAKVSKS